MQSGKNSYIITCKPVYGKNTAKGAAYIMEILEELTQKAMDVAATASGIAKDAAGAATKKAKELADTARLTTQIVTEKRELGKLYRTIGRWYVSEHQGEPPEAVAGAVAAAKAGIGRIEELTAAREELKAAAKAPASEKEEAAGETPAEEAVETAEPEAENPETGEPEA